MDQAPRQTTGPEGAAGDERAFPAPGTVAARGRPAAEREGRTLYSLAQIQHLMRVEFNRAHRYRYPVACMLIAIDRLGHARDVHGYDAKERMVRTVVGLLMELTRASDFLGRTADDRLMAVIPHTPQEGARALAERLVVSAAERTLEVEGDTLPISLSIGLSHNQAGNAMYFDSLLLAAQAALEEAVEAGGGTCVERAPGG